MSKPCPVCCHPDRLTIDRMLLNGNSVPSIASRYDVTPGSLENHKRSHISRQMLQSHENGELLASRNLSVEMSELIDRTKNILTQTESGKQHLISLKAVAELRQLFSLLIGSYYLFREDQRAEKQSTYRVEMDRIKANLSVEELEIFLLLTQKAEGKDVTIQWPVNDAKTEVEKEHIEKRPIRRIKRNVHKSPLL